MTSPRHPDAQIWAVAGPSVLANISTALVGMVDTWAIGRLSMQSALAGLAAGAFVMTMIAILLGFVRLSATGLTAQAYGARRRRTMIATTLRAIAIAAGLGAIVAVASPLIQGSVIAAWGLTGDTAANAESYLRIRLWGTPAILMYAVVVGVLIGMRRARMALRLSLLLNASNLVLTLWFVLGLEWGVAGAAWASLIAEWTAAACGVGFVVGVHGSHRMAALLRSRDLWRARELAPLAAVNGFIALRTLFLEWVFVLMSVTGGRLGDEVLAANHVLLHLVMFGSLIMNGLGSATQALTGAAKGAGQRQRFRFWSRRTALWAAGLSLLIAAVFAVFGSALVATFTDLESVRAQANAQLVWFVAIPLVAVWSYQLEGVFIGATEARLMMWSGLCAAAVFTLAWWTLVARYGNTGLWAAFVLFFMARAGALIMCYPRVVNRVFERH